MGGFGKRTKSEENSQRALDTVECYSPKANVWEPQTECLKVPRGFLKVVNLDDKLYAVGGVSSKWHDENKVVLKSVEVFDGKEWMLVAPMNQERHGGGGLNSSWHNHVLSI